MKSNHVADDNITPQIKYLKSLSPLHLLQEI
jgi:hypothetical protein